jgi:hypothetical protein
LRLCACTLFVIFCNSGIWSVLVCTLSLLRLLCYELITDEVSFLTCCHVLWLLLCYVYLLFYIYRSFYFMCVRVLKWNLSTVKPTRCKFFFSSLLNITTCFGRSLRPSSGVQDCTYSFRYMPYRLVDCLLVDKRASKQSTNLYDIYLKLYVQSCTPDDGRRDRPKRAEWYSINLKKIVHLVGFTIDIYHDARFHERQKWNLLMFCNVQIFDTSSNSFAVDAQAAQGQFLIE